MALVSLTFEGVDKVHDTGAKPPDRRLSLELRITHPRMSTSFSVTPPSAFSHRHPGRFTWGCGRDEMRGMGDDVGGTAKVRQAGNGHLSERRDGQADRRMVRDGRPSIISRLSYPDRLTYSLSICLFARHSLSMRMCILIVHDKVKLDTTVKKGTD